MTAPSARAATPRRVLHLATTYPLHAGASDAVFIREISEGLARRGHEVDVLVPWHPDLQLNRDDTLATLHAFRYSPYRSWHPWGYAQGLHADKKLRFDAYLAAVPAALSSAANIRRLMRARRYDLVHAHWLLPNAPIMAAAAGAPGTPMVISCHGSGVYMAERTAWGRRLAAYALRRAAATTGCSSDLVRRLGELGADAPTWQPYGVDVDTFAPMGPDRRAAERRQIAERHHLHPDSPWVLAVGRLVHKKGFETLVGALPRLRLRYPGVQLLIVGAGPLAAELHAIASQSGVTEALHLVGALPHRELPAYYGAADAVTVPSVRDASGNVDGLPNTLLEGLASGTPVVASAVAGIPEVLRHEVDGLLVPPGDHEQLADALASLLDNEALAGRLGQGARARAIADLGWDRVAAGFEEIYDRVSHDERANPDRR